MSRTAARVTQADVAADVPQSVVYFVRIGKNVKIGVTTNLDRREAGTNELPERLEQYKRRLLA